MSDDFTKIIKLPSVHLQTREKVNTKTCMYIESNADKYDSNRANHSKIYFLSITTASVQSVVTKDYYKCKIQILTKLTYFTIIRHREKRPLSP